MNIDNIRSLFPILDETVYGKQLVYFDNAATTQKPTPVLDAIRDVYEHKNANIHRGVHHLSNVCTDLYEHARTVVARHINAYSDKEVVFTRNTTEAINLVANTLGNQIVMPGDEVIVSELEHHSNIVPWQLLCARKNATLKVVHVNDDGTLDMDSLKDLLSPKTKIVSIAHVSNVMGTVNDVKQICFLAHSVGAIAVIDGAQSIPHHAIDVQAIGCDFFAFSGHKVYGPLGSGALWGKYDNLSQMQPWMGGGEMIDKVSFSGTTFAEPPLRFEAGTPDYVAAIGLASAIEFVDSIGIEEIERHEARLLQHLICGLKSIGDIRFIGNAKEHSGAVSFLVGNAHPYDVGMILDKMSIAVRTGHHCAQPLMERMGIVGTVRASLAVYNTLEEVDLLLIAVEKAKMMLR
ncbi:MAG: cysteine desulfurase [Bacteroidales bacterium]|nr:cysteine desulfurase [Bacteroidales bacterium]